MADLFLGKFTVGNDEYEVIEEDYLEIPDDIPADMIIAAAKQYAVLRMSRQDPAPSYKTSKLRNDDNFTRGQVPRFTGTFLIFDGNNLAHRCRHVFNLSFGGQDVSILYGVLRVISSTLAAYSDIKACAVCWDGGTPKFRKEASPEYKATRSHDEDDSYHDFLRQIKLLHAILPDFGVASLRKIGCEADDLMAGIAAQADRDTHTIIITSDQDLQQLVNYHVSIQNPNKDFLLTFENFKEQVGVAKNDYLLYKSLIGDSSDNLPGVKGIGPKTAVKLIEDYHSPSNMLNIANGVGDLEQYPVMSPSIAAKLSAFGLEGFKRMYRTVRLDRDLCGARHFTRNELELNWHPYNRLRAIKFLKTYMFASLMDPQVYQAFGNLGDPRECLLRSAEFYNYPDIRMPVYSEFRKPVEVADQSSLRPS